jgi:hypothetical protein
MILPWFQKPGSWMPPTLTYDGWEELQRLLSGDDIHAIVEGKLVITSPGWLAAGPLSKAVQTHMAVRSRLGDLGVQVPEPASLGCAAYGAYCVFWPSPTGSFRTQVGRRDRVVEDLRRTLAFVACLHAHELSRESDMLSRMEELERDTDGVVSAMRRMEDVTRDLISARRPESDQEGLLRLGRIMCDVILGQMNPMAASVLAASALAVGNAMSEFWDLKTCGFVVEDGLAPAEFFMPYLSQ